jgi:hypothetical protein
MESADFERDVTAVNSHPDVLAGLPAARAQLVIEHLTDAALAVATTDRRVTIRRAAHAETAVRGHNDSGAAGRAAALSAQIASGHSTLTGLLAALRAAHLPFTPVTAHRWVQLFNDRDWPADGVRHVGTRGRSTVEGKDVDDALAVLVAHPADAETLTILYRGNSRLRRRLRERNLVDAAFVRENADLLTVTEFVDLYRRDTDVDFLTTHVRRLCDSARTTGHRGWVYATCQDAHPWLWQLPDDLIVDALTWLFDEKYILSLVANGERVPDVLVGPALRTLQGLLSDVKTAHRYPQMLNDRGHQIMGSMLHACAVPVNVVFNDDNMRAALAHKFIDDRVTHEQLTVFCNLADDHNPPLNEALHLMHVLTPGQRTGHTT